MSKIFISYRRQDSRDITGRIYDRLLRHWEAGRIFKDVDNIDPGEDYRDVIDREIGKCALFLAVIGPAWLAAKKADGKRRLDDPGDMVRIEIETALARDQRVIPVIVGEGRMPEAEELPESLRELADRHAFPVRPDPDFHRDMDRLVQLIERAMERHEAVTAEAVDPPAPPDPPALDPVPPPPVRLGEFAPFSSVPAGQFAAQPALAAGLGTGHDSSPGQHRPWLAPASANDSRASAPPSSGLLFWAATTLLGVCLLGVLFQAFLFFGTMMQLDGTSETDPDTAALLPFVYFISICGNLIGIAAACCIYSRWFYWGAVIGTCAMALLTLLPCPFLNVPAALFVLFALLRPGGAEAFAQPGARL